MTRQELIRQLLDEYEEKRRSAEAAQARRLMDVAARDPEIARMREAQASLALDAVRVMMRHPSREEMERYARKMKDDGRRMNGEIARRLADMGLPEDYLETQYACPVCRDTGYVGEAPARFCDCFLRELARRLCEDGSMASVAEQNFETYSESVYPEEGGQRRLALFARDQCKKYADSFPDTEKLNLVLTGTGGLGKTFLLNCIYQRVTARGYSAARVTAFRLQEAMRALHMGDGDDLFRAYLETPLLLIDDLGTEPILRNITLEYLFTLLNERAAASRRTVIATNLTPKQLAERYGERIASRALDKIRGDVILLTGKDVRLA